MKKILLLTLTLFLPALSFAAPPRVVASLPPLHSLAASVLQGVATPQLLLRSGSPHSYALRPSDARALQQADLLLWVGPQLELFLAATQANLGEQRSLTLLKLPDLNRPALRHGGIWEADDAQDAMHDKMHPENAADDVHIWLDPDNAAIIIKALADRLTRLDPDNGVRYQRNGADTIHRLRELDAELQRQLEPLRDRPYIVFHDAYQSFEQHYGLHPKGAIAVDPERRPGAKRLQQIRNLLLESGAACLFREPQFEPRYVPLLIEGTAVRTGILDPLGSDLTPGPELYFTLLRNLADSLTGCLAPGENR